MPASLSLRRHGAMAAAPGRHGSTWLSHAQPWPLPQEATYGVSSSTGHGVFMRCLRRPQLPHGTAALYPSALRRPFCADYDGSCVSAIDLQSYKAFHRLSYGHRNHKTFVIVAYDPRDPVCRAAETEVLSGGVMHRGVMHCGTFACRWSVHGEDHDMDQHELACSEHSARPTSRQVCRMIAPWMACNATHLQPLPFSWTGAHPPCAAWVHAFTHGVLW
jgi:hypothetical protein